MLQRFKKLDLFVPRDTCKAGDMLCIAVAWLGLVMGCDSIATKPYNMGLKFLARRAQREHKHFTLVFLHMIECCFQKFCLALLETGTGKCPVLRAKRKVSSLCWDFIRAELGNLPNGGGVPSMSLPDCFADHNDGKPMAAGGPKGDNGKAKKSRPPELACT